MFQFSSKTPVERLGHPVVGGVTELGLEVSLSMHLLPPSLLTISSSFQHLTDIDRKEVMINLFSNSDAFEEVVRNLGYQYPIL
jgi:hypothetical protein